MSRRKGRAFGLGAIPADPVKAEERRERARAELARWKRPIDSLEAWDAFERLTGIAEGTE